MPVIDYVFINDNSVLKGCSIDSKMLSNLFRMAFLK